MRSKNPLLVLVVVLLVLTASCSKPKENEDTTGAAAEKAQVAEEAEVQEEIADTTDKTNDVADTGDTGGAKEVVDRAPENPFADLDYARRVGASLKPISTKLPNGNPNTWAGVSKDKIKAAVSYDISNCGVNLLNAISAAGANFATAGRFYRQAPTSNETLNAETRESVNLIVKIANKRALEGAEYFPNMRKLMGNDEEHPFYGRRLVHEFVDGGSFQCPETTTAAAVEIVQEKKPFVVFNNFDGTSHNMAEALHAKAPASKRPMHFGTLWLSDADYKRWSPYVWTQFNSGTRAMQLYAQWVCSTKVGKKASNSPQYKGATRKWALLHPNLQPSVKVANELKGFLKRYCGKDIIQGREFSYDTDLSRAGDQAATIAVRLKLDGVTSLMYVHDPVFPLFQIVAFAGQDYNPEKVWTPTGYYDSNTVQRLYEQPQVDKASYGLTQFGIPGGFGYEAGDPFYAYHDEHRVSPRTKKKCDPSSDAGMDHDEQYCKAPTAIVTWYYTMLPALAGILFAGPNLTPANATKGLWSYPNVRFGGSGPTQDPRPALLGSGPGKHYLITDATEYRWRAGFVSPPPEKKLGFAEYPDCQRHYVSWPDGLANGWEKGGPHYGAWCGDAKYATFDYKPSTKSGEACADAPSGRCEKDNYPRWGPENFFRK
jgi:hypothetical protein